MSEEVKAKVKALFPEDVEGIYISKNDYDRLYGDLTLENIELKQEIERLHSIIKEVRNKTIQMIANNSLDFMYRQAYKDILEMIDKVNENEKI